MKKFFKALVILACIFGLVGPVQAEFKDMWASVYTWDGDITADGRMELNHVTSGITFKVLQRNSDTAETLYEYNDNAYTSLTNPVTTTNFESSTVCNDKVMFRVDPGETDDTYVDLIVTNTVGFCSIFVEDFTENTHTIVIDQRPGVMHTGIIWYEPSATTVTGATGTEIDTGINFTYDTKIVDVRAEVITVSDGTLDIGLLSSETSGDFDGLRDNVSNSVAGFVADTGIITSGTSCDYYAITTYGALLVTAITGTGVGDTDKANNGGKSYIGHVVTGANANSLVYAAMSDADGSTAYAAGYIYIDHIRLR